MINIDEDFDDEDEEIEYYVAASCDGNIGSVFVYDGEILYKIFGKSGSIKLRICPSDLKKFVQQFCYIKIFSFQAICLVEEARTQGYEIYNELDSFPKNDSQELIESIIAFNKDESHVLNNLLKAL